MDSARLYSAPSPTHSANSQAISCQYSIPLQLVRRPTPKPSRGQPVSHHIPDALISCHSLLTDYTTYTRGPVNIINHVDNGQFGTNNGEIRVERPVSSDFDSRISCCRTHEP